MQDQSRIREVFAKAEKELNPSNAWPVDISAVLEYLGIRLELTCGSDLKAAAHLVINDRPSIVIRSKGTEHPLMNGFNRFSIAHEIGHWIIWRRFGLLPQDKSEYWAHERLCNEFAAKLLLPTEALSSFLETLVERGVHPLHFPRNVASAGQVSWHVAARSITVLPTCEYWYIRFVTFGGADLHVNCSTVANGSRYVGERAKISDPDLSTWLWNLDIGQIASQSVSFVAGAFRIRAGQASFLRERWQGSGLGAVMLTSKAKTEVSPTAVARSSATSLRSTGQAAG